MHRGFRRRRQQVGRDGLEVRRHLVLLGYSASLSFPRWLLLGGCLFSALQLLLPPAGRVNEKFILICPTSLDLFVSPTGVFT